MIADETGSDFVELFGGSFLPAVVRAVAVSDGPPCCHLPPPWSVLSPIRSTLLRCSGAFISQFNRVKLENVVFNMIWLEKDSLIQSRASAKSNSHHPMIFYGTLLSGDRETTVTSTVTSTVTTVVYQSCIQSEYLQTAAPCPFRREILDDETISPSQIEK